MVTLGALACFSDWRSRRIPNVLTFGAALAAFAFWAVTGGSSGLLRSVAGWIVGCALFLPWFLLRGMGGGDVKLLAAFGAWMGPWTVVWAAAYAAIAGGVLAVAVALPAGYLGTMMRNLWGLLTFWRVAGVRPHPGLTLATAPGPRLPYAFPITAGALVALWLA